MQNHNKMMKLYGNLNFFFAYTIETVISFIQTWHQHSSSIIQFLTEIPKKPWQTVLIGKWAGERGRGPRHGFPLDGVEGLFNNNTGEIATLKL